ncbi:unnamed protein product [Choristocarpus tenellus]
MPRSPPILWHLYVLTFFGVLCCFKGTRADVTSIAETCILKSMVTQKADSSTVEGKEYVDMSSSQPRMKPSSRRGRGRKFPDRRRTRIMPLQEEPRGHLLSRLSLKKWGSPVEVVASTGPLGDEGRMLVLRKPLEGSNASAQVVVEKGYGATSIGMRQQLNEKSWILPSLRLRTGGLIYCFVRSLDWGEVEAKVEPGREVAMRWEGDSGGAWRVDASMDLIDAEKSRMSFRRAWNM